MPTHHDRPEAVQTIYSRERSWRGMILVLFLAVAALPQDAGAQTAKGAEAKPINLGLISEINQSAVEEHFREFIRYVARRMSPGSENQAKVVIAPTVFEMAKLLEQRRVDFYMESPYPTYRINYVHGAGKILLRRWKGGQAEYQSLIITKRDGGIKQLSDLRGKTIVFEDPGSTSGYFLPKLFLSRNGFKLVEKRGYDLYASPNETTYFFVYSRRKLIESILTKQAASEKEMQTAFARRPVPARCGRPAGVAPSQAECGVAHCRWCWTGVSGWGRVAPQGCPGGDSLGTGDVGGVCPECV